MPGIYQKPLTVHAGIECGQTAAPDVNRTGHRVAADAALVSGVGDEAAVSPGPPTTNTGSSRLNRAELYYEYKAALRCTRCGAATPDSAQLCQQHLEEARAAKRTHAAARRKNKTSTARRRTHRERCETCSARYGVVSPTKVEQRVDNDDAHALERRRRPCQQHLEEARAAKRAYAKARRERETAAGRCAEGCGRRTRRHRCEVCSIRYGAIPAKKVEQRVDNGAPSASDQWRADPDGFKRYRGRGRRGAPATGVNDERDLADALDALTKGREGLEYARSPLVQALPRIQRRDAINAATSLLALAARFIDDVVDRNKREK